MARLTTGAALLLALASPAASAAEFKIMRWSEDWTEYADPARRTTPLTAIKYIPLAKAGPLDKAEPLEDAGDYLSLGGQLRYKAVSYEAPLFGLGKATSDGYVYQRINLHADLHLGAPFRAFVELGDARVYGKHDPDAPTDSDRAELMQAFGDFTAPAGSGRMTLRLGRQELAFDTAQRFVGLREGPNVRRGYDGARLIWSGEAFEATAFATSPVADRDDEPFDDRSDHGAEFDGLRLRWRAHAAASLDGYWYRYARDDAVFGGVHARERRDVFGLQSSGHEGAFDWDMEAVHEGGRFGDADIRAWAFGSVLGYTLHDVIWRPRIGVQFDAASGDRDANDRRLETFNSLFPKGSYFSQAGVTDFANLIHEGVFVTAQPTAHAGLGIAAGHMARQSRADAAYAQPMLAIPHTINAGGKAIGNYLRLNAAYRIDAHLNFAVEVLHEVPDAALRRVGAQTVDYAELVMKFLF